MLYRLLVERADASPDKIAIVGDKRSITYGQFLREVQRCASYLKHLGLQPEDPFVIGLPLTPESYILFYAAWALGAMIVPVLPSGKVPPPMQQLSPVLAAGDEMFLHALKDIWPNLRSIAWDREKGLHVGETSHAFTRKKLIRKERVVVGSSSGTTTGIPTLGFSSSEDIRRRQELRAKVLGLTAADVFLVTRPLIAANVFLQVVLPIVAGGKVVVMERFERLKAAQAIARDRVSVLYTVPPIFELLASIPPKHPVDFSSLRLCISGGSPLAMSVAEQFHRRFGLHIRQTYTGRQLTPAFTVNLTGPPEAVGHVSGPYPMALLDEEGREVEPGKIGEIAFDVSKVKDPLLRSALKSHRNRKGKYVYSGDLGKLDAEGYLYVVGRKSPFIKVGGNRVEPAEVENVLRSHPHVKEAVVFAVRPGQSDEAVGAIVVPHGRVTPRALLAYCAQKLDSYKCPPTIELRRSLPRNYQGKVMRYLFEKPLGEERTHEE